MLRDRFVVERYPKILYFDAGFPTGIPRQYYRSYGLKADKLLLWLRKQVKINITDVIYHVIPVLYVYLLLLLLLLLLLVCSMVSYMMVMILYKG